MKKVKVYIIMLIFLISFIAFVNIQNGNGFFANSYINSSNKSFDLNPSSNGGQDTKSSLSSSTQNNEMYQKSTGTTSISNYSIDTSNYFVYWQDSIE